MKKLSILNRNLALFMERFPKLAFLFQPSPEFSSKEEALSPLSLEEIDILYFYGAGRGEIYPLVKDWLKENRERRLILLSSDFTSLLQSERGEEILLDSQVILDLPSEIDALVEKFPSNKIEIASLPSLKTKKFYTLRLNLLHKATLSSALHIDRIHGYQPFINFLRNIRQLPLSFYANGLKNKFSQIPAVVCGAGPSLNQAIPYLKKMENKAVLIAGGSTLAALSSQNVSPHFGMAIDPNLEEFKRLKNSFAFEVPFLYSTRVFPDVFQTCNGPFGYMRSGIGGLLELWMEEELGLLDPLLGHSLSQDSVSVTNICLALAQFLGCNPIIISGLDLAYTGKKQYAQGVKIEDDLKLSPLNLKAAPHRIIKRKDRLGRPIETAVRFLIESTSFSHFAKMHPEITFINTTEKGLEIPGIAYQSLEEVEKKLASYPIRKKVQEEIFKSPMPSQAKEVIETKLNELKASLDRVIAHLKILAQKKSPVDELELMEEMAVSYLFYDIRQILEKERISSDDPQDKWRYFLNLAQKYSQVFDQDSSEITSSYS